MFNTRESNLTIDGKTLHARIHGSDQISIGPNDSHTFTFDIPYAEAYMSGVEIIYDCGAKTDMFVEIYNPETSQFVTYQQYGYGVNHGEAYRKECHYAAKVMIGVRLKTVVTNTASTTKKIAVNFFLHEAVEE